MATTARALWSGGQATARRTVGVFTLMLCVASSPVLVAAGQDVARHEVSVTEHDGLYTVTARFQVPQPPAIALAVLTDYEQIPRFMPGVVTSVVRQRGPRHAVVEQEALSRMWLFSRRIYLLLEVDEASDAIRFREGSGRSFSQYEGAWRVVRVDGLTVITYNLTAKPSFSVPDFVLTRLLRRDAAAMIERLQAEIALRAQTPPPPQPGEALLPTQ
jgi:carbon monoxide dehydrogenase subunit G